MLLGGQDFDIAIREYVLTNFHDFPKDKPRMMKRLLEMCAEGKIGLSSHETATISVGLLLHFILEQFDLQIDGEDKIWSMELTRNKFEELCGNTLRGTLDIVDEALRQAGMRESDIDNVVFDWIIKKIIGIFTIKRNSVQRESSLAISPGGSEVAKNPNGRL